MPRHASGAPRACATEAAAAARASAAGPRRAARRGERAASNAMWRATHRFRERAHAHLAARKAAGHGVEVFLQVHVDGRAARAAGLGRRRQLGRRSLELFAQLPQPLFAARPAARRVVGFAPGVLGRVVLHELALANVDALRASLAALVALARRGRRPARRLRRGKACATRRDAAGAARGGPPSGREVRRSGSQKSTRLWAAQRLLRRGRGASAALLLRSCAGSAAMASGAGQDGRWGRHALRGGGLPQHRRRGAKGSESRSCSRRSPWPGVTMIASRMHPSHARKERVLHGTVEGSYSPFLRLLWRNSRALPNLGLEPR